MEKPSCASANGSVPGATVQRRSTTSIDPLRRVVLIIRAKTPAVDARESFARRREQARRGGGRRGTERVGRGPWAPPEVAAPTTSACCARREVQRGRLLHRREGGRAQERDGHLLHDRTVLLTGGEDARPFRVLGERVELGHAFVQAR